MILGESRSGKSWWAKGHLAQLPASRTVIVWDPQGEYAGPRSDRPLPGARIFGTTADLIGWLRQAGPQTGGRWVVQSPRKEDFPLLCRLVYTAGRCTFAVDEASLVGRASQACAELLYLVATSRHRHVDLIFISQRPAHLAPDIRDAKTRTLLFRMRGAASLAWVRNEISPEVAERLKGLPQGACVEA